VSLANLADEVSLLHR